VRIEGNDKMVGRDMMDKDTVEECYKKNWRTETKCSRCEYSLTCETLSKIRGDNNED